MRLFIAAAFAATALGAVTTESSAEPLNCTYEPVYAPGPADLDPDGDGIWYEPGHALPTYGPILYFEQKCSGIENEEVAP